MNRIIDANFNRANEALRVIEEIARFKLENKDLSEELKLMRHKLSKISDNFYQECLSSRDTEGDIGTDIKNPSSRNTFIQIFKANFKRLQQALRVLAEYDNMNLASYENLRYTSYTLEKKMFEQLSKIYKANKLKDKKLYLVTSRNEFKSNDDFLNAVAAALNGGVGIVQLREKNCNANEFVELAKKVRDLCSLFDAIFIINDRVDIAKIVKADGVHLGQDDIDIDSARNILGADAIVGISTHSPEQAQKAVESGADYIGVGPVFTTPTKPGREAVTLDYVKWAKENVPIPWFAIGGIDLSNVKEVVNAGASQIAVVRAIINAANPEKAANEFLAAIS